MNENDFLWLVDWYHSHCDGDWEHGSNIKITTLDNPGWSININLKFTELEDIKFDEIDMQNSEHDWIICTVKDNKFDGCGGPANFPQVLRIFREWAESHKD
jgi:hypothetical protein